MNKNKILVLSDLREFTEIVAQKAIYLANKYEKEIDVLHVEDESFFKFFKEKTECSLDKSKSILQAIYKDKVKLLFSQLKESDAAVLGASALGWEVN